MRKVNESNRRRAERARIAMDIISTSNGEGETGVVNILADLRHFCDVNNIDFDKSNEMAKEHYDLEV